MNVIRFASTYADQRGWPAQQQPGGELRIEVPTEPRRTQVVTVTMARDADGDAAGFVWSKAADMREDLEPWKLLELNTRLTYGRVALRGKEIIVLHALLDDTADMAEVGKAIYHVARAADDIEAQTYGAYTDVF